MPPTGGAAIRVLTAGGIAAWVGDASAGRLPRDPAGASREALDHDRVVGQALARGITPVPASLADPYPSDEAAMADISNRVAEIRDALRKVDGMVEMATIVAPGPEASDTAPITAGPGRAYLERLRDLPVRVAALADSIDARLRPLAADSARRGDGGRIGLSHLVRRDQVAAYRAAALSGVAEGYRILVDGPRAPYSFAAFSPTRPEGSPGTAGAA